MASGVDLAEVERSGAVARYRILEGPPEPDLQTIVQLAAQLCRVPMSVIHVVDSERQYQVAAVGIDTAVCRREDSMCSVTVVAPEPVYCEDASVDPRFADNPFVTGAIQRFRFYAASQLRAPDGFVLGTLCVFDTVPRALLDDQRAGLDRLARLVVDVLELRRYRFRVAELLQQQHRAQQALEDKNRRLHAFASQLVHDLRSPLTGMLTFAAELQSLSAVRDEADASLCADRIAASARRMGTLIDDVLAEACAEHAAPHTADVDLGAITQAVLDDLTVQITEAGADIRCDQLPTVTADATQWRILLQNLISNSIKYRHPDRLCRIEVTGCVEGNSYRVCVADNGIGIPADKRDIVTRPFTQLHPERSEGHGIGLSTCARIIHSHGGHLRITDTPGGGTTMCVVIPT